MELVSLDDVEADDMEPPENIEEGLKTPTIGMYFETIEEARNYYEHYEEKYLAKKQQESVVEENDKTDEEEKVIPKKRVRRCSTVKCERKAHLWIMHDKWNCKWKVTSFDENHNHQLVTPSKRTKMKSNRNMPKAVKDLTERSKFKKDMKKCIKETYKKEDFEERWRLLMKENGLESNEWLQGLFNIRESWVPVYNRGTFFAGMNTTGRSDGINSFFDGFVTHTSNLKEFMVKHEKALKRIVKRENDEDFESEHKFRIVNDHDFLLKHVAKVYTRNAFNKFKDEWSKVFHYKVENERNANGFQFFIVKSKDDELEKFEVTLDSQTYECNKFRIIDSQGLVHDDGKEESEALRLSHMCQEATKLACLAAPSNEAYTIFIEGMNDLFEKIQEVSKVSPIEISAEKDNEKFIELSPSQILLLDPNISICKGRKKDVKGKAASTQCERSKSDIEMSLNKKKRKCHMCFQFGHDKRTCPSNPMSKTNKGFEEDAEGSDSDQEDSSYCSE
ncbi:hypothetical protein RHSIM_Rhsim11G0019000 [Rhododendron simsii]|uniref:Protein FAR1-RELATED SEQUENCE n=1 Tax=Rhododendron simsii TaxID=118357 RepID=A0A834LB18_RHOSS|nr:hypothetical protein RHSIM_Rhsim11G0019000 [Rhododendron simsii]